MGFKVRDHYFEKAKKDNYFARSAYKLEEINKKYKILNKGMNVLDLGYYPGSWTQYTAKVIGQEGLIVGIDIQEVNKKLEVIPNVRVYQKDINDVQDLSDLGVDDKFDAVISDMAPSTTGIKSVDQARSLQLVEMVFYHLPNFLRKNGNFTIKVFDSNDAQQFLREQKKRFKEFHFLKPKSTRSVSKEFFAIGKGFKE
ncbi:MAG: RlmE family RNA methyltransferase [Bacteriovoracaceae bacterium]|jgi:23S rRNA (uridine2552-2'-O)-methyltransferase|nr:RlmE family RNA methyltransferase [Bacteriovoracaceae bacterium]